MARRMARRDVTHGATHGATHGHGVTLHLAASRSGEAGGAEKPGLQGQIVQRRGPVRAGMRSAGGKSAVSGGYSPCSLILKHQSFGRQLRSQGKPLRRSPFCSSWIPLEGKGIAEPSELARTVAKGEAVRKGVQRQDRRRPNGCLDRRVPNQSFSCQQFLGNGFDSSVLKCTFPCRTRYPLS